MTNYVSDIENLTIKINKISKDFNEETRKVFIETYSKETVNENIDFQFYNIAVNSMSVFYKEAIELLQNKDLENVNVDKLESSKNTLLSNLNKSIHECALKYFNEKNFQEAEKCCRKFIEDGSTERKYLMIKFWIELDKCKTATAIQFFNEIRSGNEIDRKTDEFKRIEVKLNKWKADVTIERQIEAEESFFDFNDENNWPRDQTDYRIILSLINELTYLRSNQTYTQQDDFGLNNDSQKILPARFIITADRSLILNAKNMEGNNPDIYGYINTGWRNNENLKLGPFIVSCNYYGRSHINHVGNYCMKDVPKYPDIYTFLAKITKSDKGTQNVENEINLANLMLAFARDGQLITNESINEINNDVNDQEDINKLNRIVYNCFVKEVARRMLPRDADQNLPYGIAQGRALKLIINGHLTMKQVFSRDCDYGVFTGVEIGKNIDRVRQKIRQINDLYDEKIRQTNEIVTLDELKQELKDVYGPKEIGNPKSEIKQSADGDDLNKDLNEIEETMKKSLNIRNKQTD